MCAAAPHVSVCHPSLAHGRRRRRLGRCGRCGILEHREQCERRLHREWILFEDGRRRPVLGGRLVWGQERRRQQVSRDAASSRLSRPRWGCRGGVGVGAPGSLLACSAKLARLLRRHLSPRSWPKAHRSVPCVLGSPGPSCCFPLCPRRSRGGPCALPHSGRCGA